MSKSGFASRTAAAVALAVASICAQAQTAPAAAASAPPEAARPEVAKGLQAAQALIKEGKHAEALAKLREAETAVPSLTPYESFFIDRTRAAAALGTGDIPLTIKSLEAALATDRMKGDELRDMLRALADLTYRSKDYTKSLAMAQRYFKEGGTDPNVHTILVNDLYLSGDFANAAKEIAADVKADEAAGRATPEQTLRMLASAQAKIKDEAGYAQTLERIVARYPKPDLWGDLIWRVQSQANFGDHLRLDAYRLRLATNSMVQGAEYVEMAQLAMAAGYPAEAVKAIDQGYASGKLGTGPNAKAHQQLRDQARKQAASDAPNLAQAANGPQTGRDANAMVNIGYALATAGQADKGVALIEQGIAKGGLKRPDEARLHLGVAQWMAGQKDAAAKTLKTVQGKDGTADLARLWVLVAQAPAATTAQQ
ncbi:tetratricopeptide repeat protein [Ideonella sp. BN130291]|nr:tetratricopeptide repeat protein [Ideonella sp. BN130291]